MRWIAALAAFSIGIAMPVSAAVRQYTCNGKIQYRPCDQGSPRYSPKLATLTRKVPSPKETGALFARVVKKSYNALAGREGIWRGRIAGNGIIHLRLLIKRDGIIESTRYMGNVKLINKETWFAFKSMQPPGENWSWDIVAYNS